MNLSDSHKRILNFLESEGPHTADETQEKLGHDFHQTNSALFSKLEKEGFIEPVVKSDGNILKRKTRLNRPARVMKITNSIFNINEPTLWDENEST